MTLETTEETGVKGAPVDRSERQLVVVGSSAGGIEALATLVASLPDDFPASVVLAQHLDPNRPSNLTGILAARTGLTVETVHDHSVLAPATVYVIPPDRHVRVLDGELEVLPDGEGRPMPSINTLLSSAAEAYGND